MYFTNEQKLYESPDHLDWKGSSDQNVHYITPCLVPVEYVQQLLHMEPQITSDIKEIVNMVSTENRITRYVLKASNSISTG